MIVPRNVVLRGDAAEVLDSLPAESVHCVVTSPPYWGLRSYLPADHADKGLELGSEPTPEVYVESMVRVFQKVRRVLRPDGTCWVNIGDAYCSGTSAPRKPTTCTGPDVPSSWSSRSQPERIGCVSGLKAKDLIGIPWRLALGLQADGWWVRADIIWHKPNCMPESVTDRPTMDYEHVFLLAREPRYFYDDDAIREPFTGENDHDRTGGRYAPPGQSPHTGSRVANAYNPLGRNRRAVWSINSKPYSEAHFAVFPPDLPDVCIRAGTSERGCCPDCGAPWSRAETIWEPGCACGKVPVPCVVLDPFAGSGTTLAVAAELRRDYIGIELNPEYIKLIEQRLTPVNETRSQADNLDLFMKDPNA